MKRLGHGYAVQLLYCSDETVCLLVTRNTDIVKF